MFSTIEWVISVSLFVCHHTQNGNCAVWNVLGKGCLKKISCMRNTWKSWWTLISWSCPVSFSFPCLRLTLWDRFVEVRAWLYRCAFVKHYGMCMIPTLTPDIRSPTRSFFWMRIVAAMTAEVQHRDDTVLYLPTRTPIIQFILNHLDQSSNFNYSHTVWGLDSTVLSQDLAVLHSQHSCDSGILILWRSFIVNLSEWEEKEYIAVHDCFCVHSYCPWTQSKAHYHFHKQTQ